MSRDGSVTVLFAGEDRVFRLAWGELKKLQESLKCGPFMVLDRLQYRQWQLDDITEVLRLGLTGGGMAEGNAARLIDLYVKTEPVFPKYTNMAFQVLVAALVGPDEEPLEMPPGKTAAPNGSTIFPTEKSGSEPSTAQA